MIKRQRNEKLIKAAGLRLRQLREARDLSQEKVLFLNNIHVSKIENGYKDITIGTLVELCYIYKITLREFFEGLKYDKS
jgi:transcriptional regulator with XRE-family HTH domain